MVHQAVPVIVRYLPQKSEQGMGANRKHPITCRAHGYQKQKKKPTTSFGFHHFDFACYPIDIHTPSQLIHYIFSKNPIHCLIVSIKPFNYI